MAITSSRTNKTRGLRRWPTRETIVLRCNKLNPGSTEIFAIEVRNLDLSGTSVKTSKECVHKNSERYLISRFVRFQLGSMPTTRLSDIQKNQNYLELVYQHVRNASKQFKFFMSVRLVVGIIPYYLDETSF